MHTTVLILSLVSPLALVALALMPSFLVKEMREIQRLRHISYDRRRIDQKRARYVTRKFRPAMSELEN